MKNPARFTAAVSAVLILAISAGAEAAAEKTKIAKRKAPPPEPVYLTENKILTGKVRSVAKDGDSFVLNKTPIELTSMTRYFRVYETPLAELKKDEAILVYGKTTSVTKSSKGETGNMMVRGVVNGEARAFIDLRPTEKAKAEARREAAKRHTKLKTVLGWHKGTVESLAPIMFHVNGLPQRVQASRGTKAITITEGNKEDLAKRMYVVVVVEEESAEQTAEEEEQKSTKTKSKRSRRSKRRSRKKRKEPQAAAKTIYIAGSAALLEYLLDPPQPRTKKVRTSTSDDEDYRSGRTRDEAIQRAKPSRPR